MKRATPVWPAVRNGPSNVREQPAATGRMHDATRMENEPSPSALATDWVPLSVSPRRDRWAWVGYTSKALAILSATGVLVIAGIVSGDVLFRLMTGGSIPGALEVTETMLVVVVAFGIAEGQRRGAHVAMEVVIVRIPARIAAFARGLGYLACAALLAWMSYRGIILAFESYESGEYRFGLRRVPLWPSRAALAVGLVVLTLEVVRDIESDSRKALSRPPERSGRDRDEGRTES